MYVNFFMCLLYVFFVLVDCCYFGYVVECCYVLQFVFSVMIQKLEIVIGVCLFECDICNVSLMFEGEVFVEVVCQLVVDMEVVLVDMNDYVVWCKGRVVIVVLLLLVVGWLLLVLVVYWQCYLGVVVELFDVILDQCLDLLCQGKVDIVFIVFGFNLLEFIMQFLCVDLFYLVCCKDYVLVGKCCIKVVQLVGCEMIYLVCFISVCQYLDVVLWLGVVIYIGLEVEYLVILVVLIESGLGVSVVLELMLFQFCLFNLVVILVDVFGLVWLLLIVMFKECSLFIVV